MIPIADSFDYEYRGCELLYGRGRVAQLGNWLAENDLDRALIVCGSNVGSNDDLMTPLEEGIGERLVGVFDRTTPAKRVETVFEASDAIDRTDPDVLVGVGGGSSLDIARQTSVLAADGRSLEELRSEAQDGEVQPPDVEAGQLPVVVVPTTFAGADVSSGGSIEVLSADESPTEQPIRVRGSATPIADVVDPALFETTPKRALAGSAMNGFNKGIETVYASDANPVSDATAVHGLRLLSSAIPKVAGDGSPADGATMDRAAAGALLVQLDRKLSIVHAFGHGFSRRYDVQQGTVHAVVVPHVLQYLLSKVDASRTLLAEGLGLDPGAHAEAELVEAIVAAVTEIRDALDVPTRLRALPETREEDFTAIAEFILDDPVMDRAPEELNASVEEIESVLRDAW